MTEIFRCLAGSRLYGTNNADSDHDYKAVHLPTKRQILMGKRDQVSNVSTGSALTNNGADDVDVESFELQRFLKLASDMQTIPVEMLFVDDLNVSQQKFATVSGGFSPIWSEILDNRAKILNRNQKAFVGYCKGQAVRYSMRGKRLATYEAVCDALSSAYTDFRVEQLRPILERIDGVKFVPKQQPDGRVLDYLDVFGRQCPETLYAGKALEIYQKPVKEAGNRARSAKEAGGMDNKALYHAVRIANEGISLYQTGKIEFPCQDLPLLMRIRAGTVEIDEILDIFDEKVAILEGIGENTPLAAAPDRAWIDDFVAEVYEEIVRA